MAACTITYLWLYLHVVMLIVVNLSGTQCRRPVVGKTTVTVKSFKNISESASPKKGDQFVPYAFIVANWAVFCSQHLGDLQRANTVFV